MLQDVLAEPACADILTLADRRGLTPLFWMHVRPYGEVHLDMSSRLRLGPATLILTAGLTVRRGAQPETLVISFPQQQVGFAEPGQSGGALLVTVTSHPQAGSTQR